MAENFSPSACLELKEGTHIAKIVLMPGDPLRAKYIAEHYLTNPVLFNDVRNMLGYTGTFEGKEVSVMGSGMGMPSFTSSSTSSASRRSSVSAPPAVCLTPSMSATL